MSSYLACFFRVINTLVDTSGIIFSWRFHLFISWVFCHVLSGHSIILSLIFILASSMILCMRPFSLEMITLWNHILVGLYLLRQDRNFFDEGRFKIFNGGSNLVHGSCFFSEILSHFLFYYYGIDNFHPAIMAFMNECLFIDHELNDALAI